MSKLNRDVLYMIFEELQDNNNVLYTCLSVNKTWCELIIPILWKDPWKFLKRKKEKGKILFNVIFSHLSDESRNHLNQNLQINTYEKPSFDYISFCRHLNLNAIQWLINIIDEESDMKIIKNEVINLFINENTRFTHLYIPRQFDYQIHLIPGLKRCFSKIEFLSCNTCISDNTLIGLIEICKPIKELELFIEKYHNNPDIAKLIDSSKNLVNVKFEPNYFNYFNYSNKNESFYTLIENSLNKHADNVQCFKITEPPATKLFSSFVNLKRLELNGYARGTLWNCLDNVYLPYLQVLKASRVPLKVLISLIENTKGFLNEISIDYIFHDESNNKRIIQAICKKCPYLIYLKLLIKNSNIPELENLLINCRYLSGLCIVVSIYGEFDWDRLFLILTRSSPINLFKFKFNISPKIPIKVETLKSFFDNWRGRHPMSLRFFQTDEVKEKYIDLIEKYKIEGIVRNFKYLHRNPLEAFKWDN
ncbi:hypothetical protein RclHR1_00060003 [Rhizophagus clarus]|uniref:F-box domain-containing protein n=1 Tax=Rhizophagus clarus TaxID=94130 RepID=A0A2Z6S6Y0_9GLOM|nr:hypothetical protein RclHR1_00060003 [Rhizophagus clarus]GES74595.1 hypothetical protein GLOIN_2v1529731 [Rhizophagus clarus]